MSLYQAQEYTVFIIGVTALGVALYKQGGSVKPFAFWKRPKSVNTEPPPPPAPPPPPPLKFYGGPLDGQKHSSPVEHAVIAVVEPALNARYLYQLDASNPEAPAYRLRSITPFDQTGFIMLAIPEKPPST